jgi:hypothetical protein
MNRRITSGLAWAGLLIVLAVPTADFISQQFAPRDALSVTPGKAPAAAPKKAAPVAEVVPETKKKKLPSYISDAKDGETLEDVAVAKPAAKPEVAPFAVKPVAVAKPAPVVTSGPKVVIAAPSKPVLNVPAPTEVASTTTEINPPIPMPATMRPRVAVTQPVAEPEDIIATGSITPVNESGYAPDDEIVTDEDLADWESGPLSEFLAKRRGASGDTASDYDPDGYFLSDGPNRRTRRDEQVFPFAYN